jgi:hypothetical protein
MVPLNGVPVFTHDVIYPAFDRMAAKVFPNHVGPFLLRDCGHF